MSKRTAHKRASKTGAGRTLAPAANGPAEGGQGAAEGRGEATAASAPPVPRARAEAPSVAARVRHIADLMSSGRWSSALAFSLADEWGLAPKTVQEHSSEASRLVRGSLGSPEEMRDRLLSALDADLAALDAEPSLASRARARAAVAETWAKLVPGLLAPARSEVALTADLSTMTDEQLRALAEGKVAKG